MRLRFTDPVEGETSRVQRRWQRQSGRSAAADGSTSSESESTGPYTGVSEPVITPKPPTQTPSTDAVQVNVAAIKFVGGASDSITNPLYDRVQKKNIEPPQWRKENLLQKILGRDEPISYVRGTKATVKLDITGSGETPVWVKVTPRATLLKKTLLTGGGEKVSTDPNPTPIVFEPASRTIEVTDWNAPDYEALTFKTNRLPNEVRLSQLEITWDFEWGRTKNGDWHNAGEEPTSHETYITYDLSYRKFLPHKRPWKEVLRRACFYAHGTDTELRVSKGVTTGIYNSREFDYIEKRSHSYRDISSEPHLFGINLWRMLLNGWVDCRDGSNYYTILMRWLGIEANQIRINGTFFYKPLLPISKNPNPNDDDNWVEDSWRFHQVGILGNHSIYDPIIMIDKETPRVPTNMTKAAYKRAIFKARDFVWQANALVTEVK